MYSIWGICSILYALPPQSKESLQKDVGSKTRNTRIDTPLPSLETTELDLESDEGTNGQYDNYMYIPPVFSSGDIIMI